MEATLQVLMNGLIDYAGLFPPASQSMPEAVRRYAAYRMGPRARWLGRFVLPVSRLQEFAEAQAQAQEIVGEKWRLSVLIGNDLSADLAAIAKFQAAVIDTLEMKVAKAEDIPKAMEKIPVSITPYFEIPIHDDPAPLISALARAGARAKVRTGGVTPDLFPTPEALARFIAACARAKVPFKATAGLHHPLRSLRPLTYAPDSPKAVMHGFLNVFLAGAFAAEAMDPQSLAALLKEESSEAFSFQGAQVVWHGRSLEDKRLLAARRNFAVAFGSCSFEEPIQDLQEAGLL